MEIADINHLTFFLVKRTELPNFSSIQQNLESSATGLPLVQAITGLSLRNPVGGVRESFSFHFRPCRLQETFGIYIGEKKEQGFLSI